MKKQDCPYCGKKGAGYHHIRSCSEKPKEEPVIEESQQTKPNAICPKCGAPSVSLNSIDIDCPKCGCIDVLSLKILSNMSIKI